MVALVYLGLEGVDDFVGEGLADVVSDAVACLYGLE